MKRTLVFIIIILSCCHINAQTLTGVVYDQATKQPIPGVYVYFDGTSIVDATDNSGRFTLTVKQMINTNLVFRHLAYQTLIIEDGLYMYLPDTIYLEERPLATLGEITVRADSYSRRQRLRAFREQFLGMTQAGRSCKIVNEDDIEVWFNVSSKTLMASSDKPIEVINEYLGYRILFTLADFKVEYSSVTLDPNKVQKIYFAVSSSFTDLNPNDISIKMRRDNVYEESPNYFFKSLAYDSNPSSNHVFKIYKGESQTDSRSYFTVKDTLSLKMIHINANMIERRNPDRSLLRISVVHREKPEAEGYYREMYYLRQGNPNNPNFAQSNNNRANSSSGVYANNFVNSPFELNNLQNENRMNYYRSDVSFFTNSLLVDQYGNIDQFDKVIFSGLMGWMRAGDMLPKEYEP